LVRVRKWVMNILSEVTSDDNFGPKEIGAAVGKDRTTFLHHKGVHSDDYELYATYRNDYDEFKGEYEELIADIK